MRSAPWIPIRFRIRPLSMRSNSCTTRSRRSSAWHGGTPIRLTTSRRTRVARAASASPNQRHEEDNGYHGVAKAGVARHGLVRRCKARTLIDQEDVMSQISIFEEFLTQVAAGAPMDVAANAALAKLKGQAEPQAEPEHEPEESHDNETHAKRGTRHR